MMNMTHIEELGCRARNAESILATAGTAMKNLALERIAAALYEKSGVILSENTVDLNNAIKNDMSVAMQDRLMLDEARIKGIAAAVLSLTRLSDPIGSCLGGGIRPNGLSVLKVRVPLGVIGIIYESRPNVTVDAATLCLKAGNAVILRGGKEAFHSNKCLVDIMREAVKSVGLPEDVIQLVTDTSRESAIELMRCQYLDVIIPRGGAGLIKSCVQNATVPVIQTGTGNCHVYVDESADFSMACDIVDNAKTSRPSVCNAAESLLVHESIAKAFLPLVKERLDRHHVEIRGCTATRAILGDKVSPATDEDYATEFLDYIISVKVVASIDEALAHIEKYSTHHSEAIVTASLENATLFQRTVDAAAVYVNASTRFTDGEEFGFGAEIGISTQKLHARGPLGLTELTSIKYLLTGNGQIKC